MGQGFTGGRRVGPGLPAERATLVLIAVTLVLRFVAAGSVGLGVGESYYFSSALHPSPGYFDQPPLANLLGTLMLRLTGQVSGVVLRAPFIAIFAGTTWLMFLIGRRLFGPRAGFWAALLLNLAPVFSVSVGIFFQPDGPLMFFWLATVWCLIRVLLDEPVHRAVGWWSAAGVMLGLAMLSKYSAVFLAAGAGLFILARKDQRRWLTHPGPWIALGIAALLFVPVLVWNAHHRWISFLWQGQRGVAYHGVHLDWLVHNLSGQAMELLPWIWIPLLVELVRLSRRDPATAAVRLLIACLAAPPILLFTAVAAYSNVGNHYHWGTPGYLLLFLPLGATVDRVLRGGGALRRVAVGSLVMLSLAFMVGVTVHSVTGWARNGLGWISRWLAGGNDFTVDVIDYTALKSDFRARGLLDRHDLLVFSDKWYVAGKVDYALEGRLPVLALNTADPRAYAFFDSTGHWVGKEAVMVTTTAELDDVARRYGEYCSSLEPMGPVAVTRRGRTEVTLYLYRCDALVREFPRPYH
jgi:hypothetical protein